LIYLYDVDVSGIKFTEGAEKTLDNVINITDTELLINLMNASNFSGLSSGTKPNITGIIYINNDAEVDEGEIQQNLQENYPSLTFFFKKVKKGYAAKFVLQQGNTQTLIGTDKVSSDSFPEDSMNLFKDPSTVYQLSDLKDYMPSYNFLGWATDADGENIIVKWTELQPDDGSVQTQEVISNQWAEQVYDKDTFDYTYYAIYKKKQYIARFYDGDMIEKNSHDIIVNEGEYLTGADFAPYLDDSNLSLT
jgi:hypothetical protein